MIRSDTQILNILQKLPLVFARLAQCMWQTSLSSCYYVTHCERRASQTALLALASVHAGENL